MSIPIFVSRIKPSKNTMNGGIVKYVMPQSLPVSMYRIEATSERT